MWQRQDVKEADLVAESLYDPENVYALSEDRKPVPIAAALVGKVGYRFVQQPAAGGQGYQSVLGSGEAVAHSLTGELTWNASAGFVTVDTPRTQAVIGFLGAGEHKLKSVTVQSPTNFGALYVTAMDGQTPIESARRLLVTAVGPARNTGMEYETTSQPSPQGMPYQRLREAGTAPALLNAVTGRIEIRSGNTGSLKAWALDLVGNRVREITLSANSDAVILDLRPEHTTVYYEISIE